MSTLNHKTLCVVNPASANGRTRKAWVKVEQAMAKRGLKLEAHYTSGPGGYLYA
jgi:diacylglycerol kinase family enzyme